MRSFVASFIIAFSLVGCYNTSFEPATSRHYGATVNVAKIVYRGDIGEYTRCDVVDLGTVGVRGNSFVGHGDLLQHAAIDAAERGATHLLVVDNSRTDVVTSYTTQCTSGVCYTTPLDFNKPVGTYEALHITCPN